MRQKFTAVFNVVVDDIDKPVNKEDLIDYLQDAVSLDVDTEGLESGVVSLLIDWETLKEVNSIVPRKSERKSQES